MPTCDAFSVDIYSMRVLTPPKIYGPVTPRKRKFVNSDPMTLDITPKKFRNFTKQVQYLHFLFQYLLYLLALYSVNPYGHFEASRLGIPSYFAIYTITTLYSIFCILILYYALFINKYHKFSSPWQTRFSPTAVSTYPRLAQVRYQNDLLDIGSSIRSSIGTGWISQQE